jgi:hypothetical protein
MKTTLHLVWVTLLSIGAIVSVHFLCLGTVRCEERCGGELWCAATFALVVGGLLGWRWIEHIARERGWR